MSSFRRAAPASVPAARPPNGAGGLSAAVGSQPVGHEPAPTPASQASIPSQALPGTRRWIDGQLLMSTGHSQLDAFIGGGLPLGSIVLLEEDARGAHATSLAKVFLAEGIACGQAVSLVSWNLQAGLKAFLESLPANVSRDSKDTVSATQAGKEAIAHRKAGADVQGEKAGDEDGSAGSGSDSDSDDDTAGVEDKLNRLRVDDAGKRDDTAVAGLKIAWQYRKYLGPQQQHLSASAVKYGHTFDLHRRIHPLTLEQSGAAVVSASALANSLQPMSDLSGTDGARAFYNALYKQLLPSIVGSQQTGARRVLISGLGSSCWLGFTGPDVTALLAACASPHPLPSSRPPHPAAPDADALPHASCLEVHAPMLRFVVALRRALQQQGRQRQEGADATLQQLPLSSTQPAAVVVITAPTHLMPLAVAARLRAYADLVLKVHAFGDPQLGLATGLRDAAQHVAASLAGQGGGGASAAAVVATEFSDYAGMLLIRKVPRLGGFSGFQPETLTLAFKRDKRKMVIEKPHVPPEGETGGPTSSAAASKASNSVAAGGQPQSHSHGGMTCSSAHSAPPKGSVLDF